MELGFTKFQEGIPMSYWSYLPILPAGRIVPWSKIHQRPELGGEHFKVRFTLTIATILTNSIALGSDIIQECLWACNYTARFNRWMKAVSTWVLTIA